MGLVNPLGQQIYSANDKTLQFVNDYVNALAALMQAFDRVDDLNEKAGLLGYADPVTGITDALLSGNAFDYLDRAMLINAFTQYTLLRAEYSTTIQAALARVLK